MEPFEHAGLELTQRAEASRAARSALPSGRMSGARRWLLIALLASFPGCSDDHDAGADGGGAAEHDASHAGAADAGATHDASGSADAGGASGSDAGGASGSDAGGATSSDAGGSSSSDAGGSGSSDASTTTDAGSKDSGASQDAATSADSGAPAGKISCDSRRVACDIVEPVCPQNQVPSVKGGCYGPCVVIDQCSCDDAPECPHPETYVCHRSAHHCGPYVN